MAFRKLEAQAIPEALVIPVVLHDLKPSPTLWVEHMGETNKGFWQDALARANVAASVGAGKRTRITDAKVKEARLKNRELVAKHSVRRMENVFHDDGTPAKAEDIRDFVFALPDDVFDKLLEFVSDPNNFRDEPIVGDASELAGK